MIRSSFRLGRLMLVVAVAVSLAPSWAAAHGRVDYDFYFGAPIFPRAYWYEGYHRPWGYGYPYAYSYPYAYYPPATVITVPAAPLNYVEQSPVPAGYWYHCANPEGYYPYVKACPGGWRQVLPQPPAPASEPAVR
jgi:hypothetical protein